MAFGRKIPLPKSRGLKKLYSLLLLYMMKDYDSSGLCTAIVTIKGMGWISRIEYDLLRSDFMSRKPAGKHASEFWFSSKDERIKFLQTIIDSL